MVILIEYHCGLLPRIPSFEKFEGRIITTELTAKLTAINLRDGCNLHMKEVERFNKNKKNKHQQMIPYMNSKSTEDVINRIQCYSYNKKIILNENITVELLPAGHISGACMVLIEVKENYKMEKILFSGDTSGIDKSVPFTMMPNIKDLKVNHLITESTYNDRLMPKTDVVRELEQYISETCIQNKKSIAIPVFSISRSTNMLWYLREVYKKNPQFEKIPIYFCSPMACKANREICSPSNVEFYDEKWKNEIDIVDWKQVQYVEKFKKVEEIVNRREPSIYLSSSGMMGGGYIMHIISKLLTRKNNRIIFCGFQCEGTTGFNLLHGVQKNITITNEDGEKLVCPIVAEVSEIKGMSSHCDYQNLIHMWNNIEKKKLKTILLNHGNPEGMEFFKNELERALPNADVKITKYNEAIRLV